MILPTLERKAGSDAGVIAPEIVVVGLGTSVVAWVVDDDIVGPGAGELRFVTGDGEPVGVGVGRVVGGASTVVPAGLGEACSELVCPELTVPEPGADPVVDPFPVIGPVEPGPCGAAVVESAPTAAAPVGSASISVEHPATSSTHIAMSATHVFAARQVTVTCPSSPVERLTAGHHPNTVARHGRRGPVIRRTRTGSAGVLVEARGDRLGYPNAQRLHLVDHHGGGGSVDIGGR